jgi:hypothetical protein
MPEDWNRVKASDVQVGDVVRTPGGGVLIVSRIDTSLMARAGMLSFIEDTAERWFKQPVPPDADVEVRVSS